MYFPGQNAKQPGNTHKAAQNAKAPLYRPSGKKHEIHIDAALKYDKPLRVPADGAASRGHPNGAELPYPFVTGEIAFCVGREDHEV